MDKIESTFPKLGKAAGNERFTHASETADTQLADILTVEEAAARLRVNRKTLYEVIRVNKPAWAVHFGRSIRIHWRTLLEEFRSKGGPALGDKRRACD